MDDDDIIDGVELTANRIGVCPRTLYNWRYEGKGPRSFKVGKLVKYRRSDVNEWIEEQIAAEAS